MVVLDGVIAMLVVGVAAGMVTVLIRGATRRNVPWQVNRHTMNNGRLAIVCEKPGEPPFVIGSVGQDDTMRLAELTSQAEETCADLNQRT